MPKHHIQTDDGQKFKYCNRWNCAASPIPSNDLWLQMIEAGASTEEIQACIQEFQRKEVCQLLGSYSLCAVNLKLKQVLNV